MELALMWTILSKQIHPWQQIHVFAGGVPSPLDEEAEQAALALKEQAKRNKEQQKEQLIAMQKRENDLAKHEAAATTQVAALPKSGSRFSGLANSDADRALRLAAVESRMGIVRCVQCNNIITGPAFDQMGFKYCSTACINHHRKSLPNWFSTYYVVAITVKE